MEMIFIRVKFICNELHVPQVLSQKSIPISHLTIHLYMNNQHFRTLKNIVQCTIHICFTQFTGMYSIASIHAQICTHISNYVCLHCIFQTLSVHRISIKRWTIKSNGNWNWTKIWIRIFCMNKWYLQQT